jgi:hypothetical protein
MVAGVFSYETPMHFPDIDALPFEELNNEVRIRARIYEGHKRTIENPKNLYEMDQAIEKLPASRETLRAVTNEWFKRMEKVT